MMKYKFDFGFCTHKTAVWFVLARTALRFLLTFIHTCEIYSYLGDLVSVHLKVHLHEIFLF
jgi:hypothetical protein